MRLQLQVDDEFGFDVSVFETGDLRRLAAKIGEFLATGVEPEDLKAAGDYTQAEYTAAKAPAKAKKAP